LLLFLGMFQTHLWGQQNLSQQITLRKTYRNPIELLDTLSHTTQLEFSYLQEKFDGKKIKVRKGVWALQQLLDKIAERTNCRYKVIGNTVVFKGLESQEIKEKRTISGFIIEDSTGESVADAFIYLENSNQVYRANHVGYFSFIAPPRDSFSIICLSGFKSAITKSITATKDTFLIIVLPKPKSIKLLTLGPGENKSIFSENDVGLLKIPSNKLKSLPPFLGEYDPIKPLTYMPGISKGTEGNNGLYIRGGSPDQNLVTLDGALLFNPSHLLGLYSPFNADAVRNISLQKSGFEADKGGRLSSLLAVDLKEGNQYRHNLSFTISPIATSVSANGPIASPKTTYLISLRRSYFDLVITPFIADNTSTGFYFYDAVFGITHRINRKNKISLTLFSSQDKGFNKSKFTLKDIKGKDYTETSEQSLGWNNQLINLKFDSRLKKNVFLESNVYFSYFGYNNGINYRRKIDSFSFSVEDYSSEYKYSSDVFNISSNHGITHWIGQKLKLKYGLGYTYHSFMPGSSQYTVLRNSIVNSPINLNDPKVFANETYVYTDVRYEINSHLYFNAGLRYSSYHTTTVDYYNPQPRISLNCKTKNQWFFKPSYSRTTQYLHFASNNTIGLPVDLWLPVTKNLKPEQANQYGIQIQKINKVLNFNVELYYKKMKELIDYADGTEYVGLSKKWEDKFVQGEGEAYGAEFLIEKKLGKTTGWLGYTISKNDRRFDSINSGRSYPFKFDRRHDISVVINHTISKKVDFFVTWVYATGNAITLPIARYPSASKDPYQDVYIYGPRNSNRVSDYHKLDFVVNFYKQKKKYMRTLSVSLNNAYNRQNPFYITPGTDKDGNRAFIQVSLLPILPSISYRIEFN